MDVRIKRVYESPDAGDGYRVLVDRLWPRGVAKADAAIELWLKDVGPSTKLRQWFGHEPERFAEFSRRYREELRQNPALAELRSLAAEHAVLTLVYSAKDELHNQAVVLRSVLEG